MLFEASFTKIWDYLDTDICSLFSLDFHHTEAVQKCVSNFYCICNEQ